MPDRGVSRIFALAADAEAVFFWRDVLFSMDLCHRIFGCRRDDGTNKFGYVEWIYSISGGGHSRSSFSGMVFNGAKGRQEIKNFKRGGKGPTKQ